MAKPPTPTAAPLPKQGLKRVGVCPDAHRSYGCPASRLQPLGTPGSTTALSQLSWAGCAPSQHMLSGPPAPSSPHPRLGLPGACGMPSPQGASPGGLCPSPGGHEEGGLRWRGLGTLGGHEHVELDEWWSNDTHLSAQGVEAEVDAAQGGHGGQLLHRHIC